MPDRDLDIVLYGATGFVGALTAAHLAQHAGPGVRIALAGRSRSKLEALRIELGPPASSWELVAVDATDAPGLRGLAARTRVLATTVGPYATHGKEVARACAESGTHYADLTGEVLFVRWSLDELDARARETGAAIVHACGFDSIPSDLGVLTTAERVAADGEGTPGRDDAPRPVAQGRLLRWDHRLGPAAGHHRSCRRPSPARFSATRMRSAPGAPRSPRRADGRPRRSPGSRVRRPAAPTRAGRPGPGHGPVDRARSSWRRSTPASCACRTR